MLERVGDRCYVCGQLASTRCARCGRGICLEHLPAGDCRCVDCELVYARRGSGAIAQVVLVLFTVLAIGGAWVWGRYLDHAGYLAARGGDTLWAQFAVYFSLTIAAVGAAGALGWVLTHHRRHRFLAERIK